MVCKFESVVYLFAAVVTVSSMAFHDTMYVNEGERFTVPCKNQTPGEFFGLVWKTKIDLYIYLTTTGISIDDVIYKRSRLVKETALQVDNARVSDTGSYECNLLYKPKDGGFPHVMLASKVQIIVFARPNITSLTPDTVYESVGRKASITCTFHGVPYANVSWRFEGNKDLTDRYTTKNQISILKLRRLKKRDTGYYTCVAYNRAGQIEKRAYVKVMYPPEIRYITPNPHINVDRSGKITCKAQGYPIPRLSWYIETGQTNMELSARHTRQGEFSVYLPKENIVEETAEITLTIDSVQLKHWRFNYTCVASSDQGSKTKLVHVKGFDKPKSPQLIHIQITTNKAMLYWSIPKDGGSKILAYVVQYKNASEKDWISREIRPANVQSFQIMELKPNTYYAFRISAKNEVGMSPFSDVLRAATPKEQKNSGIDNSRTIKPSKQDSKASKSKDGLLGNFGITALVGVIAGVFLLMLFGCVTVFCLLKKVQKSANSQTASVLGSRPVSMENGSLAPPEGRRPSEMPSETTEFVPLLTRADHWEFPRVRLRLSTILGSGAFGMVMRGDAQGIRGSSGSVKVAVKIAKDNDNEYAKKDLHAELDVLKLLPEHPNVIGLLGCCTRNEPLMIIVEYCTHGDLQGFLRNSRGISETYYKSTFYPIGQKMTSKMLLTFALQIAKGMSHLAAFKVIHRDLAARNILVDENLVCKISDFGFARDVYVEDQYMKKSKGGRFPIKWMAIESLLDGISTSKSDVWSFGVLLWEIVTLGASPYPGMNSYEVVSFLQDGYRMDKPKHCTDELYAVSMNCWHITPQRRPTFDELADMLKQMVDEDKEFINMNFYQDHLYENFDVNLACQTSASATACAMELNANETTPLTSNMAGASDVAEGAIAESSS